MAQIKSIYRWGQNPSRNLIHSFSIERVVLANRCGIRICSAIMLLCWATTCTAGGSGSGIGFKVGAQTIDSPSDLDKTTRTRFELEFASPRFGNDYFDLALTFGGSSLGSFDDEYAGYDDDVLIEEYYTDRYSLFDLRLVGRLYPLGDKSWLQPYVGAGIGYFWFLDSWEYEYYETYEDPLFPGVFYTYSEAADGRDTLANGLFPFVTAGLMVPIASNFELQFEMQYHYDKEDSGFDFGGPVYMFGCLFRF
ncbi:outer membrane beta-barrel protein [bacterium]|nr:outer membrane beta-barrel protein [bacterium]